MLIVTLSSLPLAHASYGTLSITVKTKDGAVLPNAIVKINETISKTTNVNGIASFTKVNLYARHTIDVSYLNFSVYRLTDFNASGSASVTLIVDVSNWKIKVYDNSGKDVVPNAIVNVKVDTLVRESKTDKDGVAVFENLPWRSDYRVRIIYAGREVFSEEKPLNNDTRSIEVRARLYNLVVRISDKNGKPVQGVEVNVWNGSKAYPVYASATSRSDGKVSLKFLVPENYIVLSTYKGDILANDTVNITGDKTHSVVAPLQMVNVTVYNFKGNKIIKGENYELKGQLFRDGSAYSDVVTTKDGILRLGHAYYPGNYNLVVSFMGVKVYEGACNVTEQTAVFNIKAKFYDFFVQISDEGLFSRKLGEDVKVKLSIKDDFSVTATTMQGTAIFNDVPPTTYKYEVYYGIYPVGKGEVGFSVDREIVNLKLKTHTLNLTLVNSEGDGVPATVTIRTYDGKLLGDVTADEKGLARISGLIPIRYSLYVKHMGFNVATVDNLVIDSDREMIMETNVHNLKLEVLDYDGIAPVNGAEVTVRVGDTRLSGTTNSSGIVIIKNVPQTTCSLLIELYGVEIYRDFLTVTSSALRTISKTHVYDVVVRVFDADKAPLGEGAVSVLFGNNELKTEVIAEGTARIENIPASRLLIRHYLYGVNTGEVSPTLQYDEQIVELLSRVYSVTISYKMADDKPMPSGYVKVYLGGKELMTLELDKNGRISKRLPRGDYTFVAYYQDTEVSRKELSIYERVNVLLDAKVYFTVFKLKNIEGEPIEGAKVRLSKEGSSPIQGITGQDGTFSTYLAKGIYNCQIRIGDYVLDSKYEANTNNEIAIVHLTPKVMEPYIVLGAAVGIIGLVGYSYTKKFIKKRSISRRPALQRPKIRDSEETDVRRRRLPRL
ncbi:MAG: carboxypeptidase-like regulatory domain-containing protein [Nitrososphaerota archaeon]|nr:carboxypeptidase-like regulatory domain-containing protein [Aigarchaeota archaeon]MDW8076751.1 carboxypeptidase-like regulatory domain-containing protein [Nitrososphaerota archaeon]